MDGDHYIKILSLLQLGEFVGQKEIERRKSYQLAQLAFRLTRSMPCKGRLSWPSLKLVNIFHTDDLYPLFWTSQDLSLKKTETQICRVCLQSSQNIQKINFSFQQTHECDLRSKDFWLFRNAGNTIRYNPLTDTHFKQPIISISRFLIW